MTEDFIKNYQQRFNTLGSGLKGSQAWLLKELQVMTARADGWHHVKFEVLRLLGIGDWLRPNQFNEGFPYIPVVIDGDIKRYFVDYELFCLLVGLEVRFYFHLNEFRLDDFSAVEMVSMYDRLSFQALQERLDRLSYREISSNSGCSPAKSNNR